MNSPDKINLFIAKAGELDKQYASDEISELYRRVKIHLTREEKIELTAGKTLCGALFGTFETIIKRLKTR